MAVLEFNAIAEMVAFGGGIITLLIFARNDGKRAGQVNAIQTQVAEELAGLKSSLTGGFADVRSEFRRFNDHIDENMRYREVQAEWRGDINGRVQRVETRLRDGEGKHEDLRKRVHDVGEKTGIALSGVEVLKERTKHLVA